MLLTLHRENSNNEPIRKTDGPAGGGRCRYSRGRCGDSRGGWVQSRLRSDGREAVDYLEAHPIPAAIICDSMMPRMNGVELVEHLRRSVKLANIPTILLSGSPHIDTPADLHILRKPVELSTLLETLRSVIKDTSA